MIDHMNLIVSDYQQSKAFYLAALEPLGYALVMELSREHIPNLPFENGCGLGVRGKPDLWLHPGPSIVAFDV
jgi:catechol 2,3-dioxygenase-like lactoylglutathione lyase family enzyme